jgi:hypothetical protein
MPDTCYCGSGKSKLSLYDARGIFCCYYCDDCEQEKRAQYRAEVLMDPGYDYDEQVEPDWNAQAELEEYHGE